jgi:hypothetical protein
LVGNFGFQGGAAISVPPVEVLAFALGCREFLLCPRAVSPELLLLWA